MSFPGVSVGLNLFQAGQLVSVSSRQLLWSEPSLQLFSESRPYSVASSKIINVYSRNKNVYVNIQNMTKLNKV